MGLASFKVVVNLPKGVSRERMAKYILMEVTSNTGCLDPWNDDLFYLDRTKVKVIDSLEGKTYTRDERAVVFVEDREPT